MLFPGDQKVEHLNNDFFGKNIPTEVADPEHFFKIAEKSQIGAFGTQIGLISRYGRDYPQLPYLVKLNAKTNLIKAETDDPISNAWIDIEQVIKFKKQSKINIIGVGYTLYIGSKYESIMLRQVSQLIFKAHQAGLTVLLWVYPRGPKINENDIHTIAGGAGVAGALDADFVKIKYPYHQKNRLAAAKKFQEAVQAAGQTKVICVGGRKRSVKLLLEDLAKQIKISGTNGLAMGRNFHQRSLVEATRLAAALSAVIFDEKTASEAYKIYSKPPKTSSSKKSKLLGLF
jgi:fructose-bisphosphate aldolase/6-deoxy-5-ketofructose 1-phosphate synthase